MYGRFETSFATIIHVLNLVRRYRGFKPKHKPGDEKGFSIIVVPGKHQGLKRHSGTLGSILDLKFERYIDLGCENTLVFPATIQI